MENYPRREYRRDFDTERAVPTGSEETYTRGCRDSHEKTGVLTWNEEEENKYVTVTDHKTGHPNRDQKNGRKSHYPTGILNNGFDPVITDPVYGLTYTTVPLVSFGPDAKKGLEGAKV